jgi:hypothetical protein
MPVHDWTRVDAGTFHAFHTVWIAELMVSLNGGLLPAGYYAMAEQHLGRLVPDVLTLQVPEAEPAESPNEGAVAVAVAPPRLQKRVLSPDATYRAARRTLVVRRERGHRIVALVEIASPGNKDRPESVTSFVAKVDSALQAGCHVVVVDLFPPGPHDLRGLHGAFWEQYGEEEVTDPEQPLTLASYVAGRLPEAYVATLGVGEQLPEVPLFLTPDAYVNLPLEPTYQAAFRGMPAYWRGVVEGPRTGARS